MQLFYTPAALKDLQTVPKRDRVIIADKLDLYVEHNDPLVFAKPLTGHHGFFRYRIAYWRVIVQPRGDCLIVHVIDRRSRVYRSL